MYCLSWGEDTFMICITFSNEANITLLTQYFNQKLMIKMNKLKI